MDAIIIQVCAGKFADTSTLNSDEEAVRSGQQWSQFISDHPALMDNATQMMKRFPPPPELMELSLPNGKLAALGVLRGEVDFLDLDSVSRANNKATAHLFKVFEPGIASGDGPGTQVVSNVEFDCGNHTFRELGSLVFNADDTLILWLPAKPDARAIVPKSGYATTFEPVACNGLASTKDLVVGHGTAYARAHEIIHSGASEAQNTQ
ncbi:hypothetical protein [Phenylobacterium montanum]|uniref:Uncharacterized protein n=1 Tax=Phenylobacterium montanum TaxID=2823693 RepID=A0A975G3Q5_9CAUL|nr:hypothetical protein [Caulobacter sp. S6]QUD90575.1 hypothetical protein KCG34_12240 [Caulobacter sp. S6]